jgi:hypothetical protein
MSATDRETLRAAAKDHERARTLAAASIDGGLSPASASWLATHLRGCEACTLIAADYRALHDELRGLARPEPPRDLWARTSAGLDGVDRSRAARSAAWRLFLARNRYILGSAVAGVAVVALVAVSMFPRGPVASPGRGSTPPGQIAAASPSVGNVAQAPLAVVDGTSYWVAPSNGVYQIRGGSTECSGAADSCAVTSGASTLLGSIASKSAVSVVIAPNVGQAAIWTSSKVVILPLTDSAPQTVSIDLLTPRPSHSAATVAATAISTPEMSPSVEPAASAAATSEPTGEATTAPTVATTPAPDHSQAVVPTRTAAPLDNSGQPTAILDGYRVVGRAPEFSTDGLWVAFSARPAAQSSGSDVFVWRVGWDRAVAVTAGHADLFAGWLGPRILISEFATTQQVLGGAPEQTFPASSDASASPVPPASASSTMTAVSWVYDPVTGNASRIDRQPMLLPVVDPTGRYVVYWSGSVRFDQATGLWVPGQGDLYFDLWSDIKLVPAHMADGATPTPAPLRTAAPTEPVQASPTPDDSAAAAVPDQIQLQGRIGLAAQSLAPLEQNAAGLPQILPVTSTPGAVRTWAVRWDATGRYVAIWVANPGTSDMGVVTLLDVIPSTQLLNTSAVLLSKPARPNIQFDAQRFVYTAPAQGSAPGTTYFFELPALPPTPPATAEPTQAASSSPDQRVAGTPTPGPTDSPSS